VSRVFIVAAKRTATGSLLGALKDMPAPLLGAEVVKQLLKDSNLDGNDIDEIFVGNIYTAGLGGGPARQTQIFGGIPVEKTSSAVNMLCASGMKSIIHGYAYIKAGMRNIVLAAGQESMTRAPFLIPGLKMREGNKLGDFQVIDHMLMDGLVDPFNNYHMGVTAENIAKNYKISRERQDLFAFESQQKAIKAIDDGVFDAEIVPLTLKSKKGDIVFNRDETVNRTTSLEKMSQLKPVFVKDGGTVTAANASSINDGASGVILASEDAIKKHNLKPLAEIIGFGQGGVDPSIMGIAPVEAVKDALTRANMDLSQIQLIELNEAFAAQTLAVLDDLAKDYKVDRNHLGAITNVNGGGIALGHAVGSSGNRITVSLIYEMKRRNLDYGLATLCIGGGMGTALIIKNIK
jgi:acetyl-CoA C-acetyltransferase